MMGKFVFILGLCWASVVLAVCPDGYTSADGATSADDCYMEIAPGYYWTGSAVEICPGDFACAGGNMPYAERGAKWGIVDCNEGKPSTYTGMTHCGCPINPLDGKPGVYNTYYSCLSQVSTGTGLNIGFDNYTTGMANCYWNGTSYALGGYNYYGCDNYSITACAAGYYAPVTYRVSNIPLNCIPVEAGYYSPEGATERTACPAGTTTIGYGAAADEAADCGHILHVGENKVYLRSTKKTTPSLHVKIENATYYGNMSTEVKGKVRIKKDNTTYSVYDDSM